MARKRKRGKKSKRDSGGLSEGVKKSILAVLLVAAGLIFLLGFFGLAGSVGVMVDGVLSSVFGWDRWLFAILLFVFGWNAVFPDRRVLTGLNIVGVVLFFISLNGLLNIALVDDVANAEELFKAGGYLGLVYSSFITGFFGLWGTVVVACATLLISVFLIFNVSLHSMATAHTHLTGLGRILHRKKMRDEYEDEEDDEEWDEDEEELVEEEQYEEDEYEEEEDEGPKYVPDAGNESEIAPESVMTSRRRRKMEIPIDLLDDKSSDAKSGDIERNQEIIVRTFENFNIDVEMADVRVGPAVTQYAMRPAQGVKLSRIVALQNDLALALAAHPIRIEAPIPGRSLVGIEVPNQAVGRVSLRELIESKEFKQRKTEFTAPLGKDVGGGCQTLAVDKAPHMLVAGATGSGKSVCLNTIIVSLLYQNGPDDLKLIMVDPKRVELGGYAGIPHLLVPPITKVDEAINALKWAVREMERRLDHLAKAGARDIDAYNKKNKERMPKIVIILDELADLMSQNKRDVEAVIVRIAQMARAAGIHLILATQRPSVDVITGTIKANVPTRVAFAVASQVDSKTIIDTAGAEKLLGRGDMLFTTPAISKPKRAQGAFISDKEIARIVAFLKKEGEPDYNYQVTEDARTGGTVLNAEDADPLLEDAAAIVIEAGKASTSFLQRRLKIGYSRAARIMDMLEEVGVIGEQNGSKPREVLVDSWPPAGSGADDDYEDDEYEGDDDIDVDEEYDEEEPSDDYDDEEDEEEVDEDEEEWDEDE